MLKLLTKFKTQSLNEVKPYESNGSFHVSFCGEVQDDNGVPNQSWPSEDACGQQPEEVIGGSKAGVTSTCFLGRLPQNDLVKTVHSPTEIMSNRPIQLKHDNKENGEQRDGHRQRKQEGISSAEKRKLSNMKRHRSSKHLGCGGDSSSSDEEVKELFSKQQRNEQQSTRNVHENRQYKSVQSGKIRPCDSHARKRHRLTFSEDRIYRPSLDFEKMQQKVFWRKSSYSSSRPRIVKVRSFSGHLHNLLQDTSVVSFQPIQAIKTYKLTPVDEPRALAY